jgi:hypothetical protein
MRNISIGSNVKFETPRGRSGLGKVVRIRETGRGHWFEVKPKDGSSNVCVRVSGLS